MFLFCSRMRKILIAVVSIYCCSDTEAQASTSYPDKAPNLLCWYIICTIIWPEMIMINWRARKKFRNFVHHLLEWEAGDLKPKSHHSFCAFFAQTSADGSSCPALPLSKNWYSYLIKAQAVLLVQLVHRNCSSYSVTLLVKNQKIFWCIVLKTYWKARKPFPAFLPSAADNLHFENSQVLLNQLLHFLSALVPAIPVKKKDKTQIKPKHSACFILLLMNHRPFLCCRQRQFLLRVTYLFTSWVTWKGTQYNRR